MIFSGFRAILVVVAAFLAAACSLPEPYVQREWEFNRDSPYFPSGPKFIDKLTGEERKVALQVIVCYAKNSADPAKIVGLARDECGKYGLTPKFFEQTLNYCPLMTPVAAVYNCSGQIAAAKNPAAAAYATGGRAPTTESSPRFLFNAPGINDRREQK